jgi:exo-beta-1,3-glucanase (GH17 family)
LYDSGENSATVLRLIDEHNLDIKVMLGIWLNAELSNHESCAWLTEPIPQETLDKNNIVNAREIKRGIELANKYKDIVVAVNVANEALVDWNDHRVDVDTLISYVRQVKSAIKQPVTVAENYEWWTAHGEKLAKELDFIAIHIYPIWEGKDIKEGIKYSIENVQKVRNALPDARIVISEAGWATTASEFGDRASEEKQKKYYDWIKKWSAEMNITTFFFEAFDEDWKGDPNAPSGAEKHWGLYKVDRIPKKAMTR